ncbi:MAG: cyclic nucleotide-binding domain-containing protein [Deltaproteobacteria bacterium]|nr:cyclic nucleotide-binding domain-containing protein [Deltaproteobacteria bacterium]MBI3061954.1 cyclic nucleotide-binding domain-containing protein [Deltaproteobacteria bacterium]
METGDLGRVYQAGETIVRQGEPGQCMYVIQSGQVVVVQEKAQSEVPLAVLNKGDFFGEMALFEREARSATVRALEDSRVLTVDRKTFLRRIQEDPSIAFRLVEAMSRRIRELDQEISRIKSTFEVRDFNPASKRP